MTWLVQYALSIIKIKIGSSRSVIHSHNQWITDLVLHDGMELCFKGFVLRLLFAAAGKYEKHAYD